jgi:hypothetical protein
MFATPGSCIDFSETYWTSGVQNDGSETYWEVC